MVKRRPQHLPLPLPLPLTLLVLAVVVGGGEAFLAGGAGRPSLAPPPLLSSTQANAQGSEISSRTPMRECDVAIVGAGPAGLTTALMLAGCLPNSTRIAVFERLGEPPAPESGEWVEQPERHYLLGIGGRGQRILEEVGAMEIVKSNSQAVLGRMDYPSSDAEGQLRLSNKVYETQILARDRLTSCLLTELRKRYPEIPVHFGTECTEVISWGDDAEKPVELAVAPASWVGPQQQFDSFCLRAGLVVGTDGVGSAVRNSMLETAGKGAMRAKRFEDKNERQYKTLLLKFPESWRHDLNYSARSSVDINLEALPTKEGLMVAVVLFRPADKLIGGIHTAEDAKSFFEEHFPMYAPYASQEALETFAAAKPSRLPSFSYVDRSLHLGKRGVLLGDAIHAVKPYFGLGYAACALDILALKEALEETSFNFQEALPLYSKRQANEARALVEMSRTFDHTGFRQFAQFIFPIIVDGIFHSQFPRLFRPNTIKFLQEDGFTFTQVRKRKYLDRAGQVLVTAGLVKGGWAAVRLALNVALKCL